MCELRTRSRGCLPALRRLTTSDPPFGTNLAALRLVEARKTCPASLPPLASCCLILVQIKCRRGRIRTAPDRFNSGRRWQHPVAISEQNRTRLQQPQWPSRHDSAFIGTNTTIQTAHQRDKFCHGSESETWLPPGCGAASRSAMGSSARALSGSGISVLWRVDSAGEPAAESGTGLRQSGPDSIRPDLRPIRKEPP